MARHGKLHKDNPAKVKESPKKDKARPDRLENRKSLTDPQDAVEKGYKAIPLSIYIDMYLPRIYITV